MSYKAYTRYACDWLGDFVVNVVDESLVEAMHKTDEPYPRDVDEIQEVGLTAIKSDPVKDPRIAGGPGQIGVPPEPHRAINETASGHQRCLW